MKELKQKVCATKGNKNSAVKKGLLLGFKS
jgi:hypothetical protein